MQDIPKTEMTTLALHYGQFFVICSRSLLDEDSPNICAWHCVVALPFVTAGIKTSERAPPRAVGSPCPYHRVHLVCPCWTHQHWYRMYFSRGNICWGHRFRCQWQVISEAAEAMAPARTTSKADRRLVSRVAGSHTRALQGVPPRLWVSHMMSVNTIRRYSQFGTELLQGCRRTFYNIWWILSSTVRVIKKNRPLPLLCDAQSRSPRVFGRGYF